MHTCIMYFCSNPCCKYPNGNLTHFGLPHVSISCLLLVVMFLCSLSTAKVRLLTHGSPSLNKGEQRSRGSYVQGGARSGAISSYITHLNGSPTFLIRQKGEKESKSEDQAQEQAKDFTKFTRQGQDASYTKGALVFDTFVSFICFRILFVIIKKGEIVEAT